MMKRTREKHDPVARVSWVVASILRFASPALIVAYFANRFGAVVERGFAPIFCMVVVLPVAEPPSLLDDGPPRITLGN